MTSPPCQAFSMAGKRLGKEDKRGILFFNSHEFIQKNNPRYFIFENVKGLLSHEEGKTFQEWINYLGGKSINGLPVLFPDENAVPYHLYYKVLNSKKLNVPQNRERIFIIGIRDDEDNHFRWPKDEHLIKKLKDVLEEEADDKYFLSDKMINDFIKKDEFIKVKSATKKGYELAKEGDSINLSVPNSETRRGRVGKEVAQTLDTQCNQASFKDGLIRRLTPRECFRLMDFPDAFTWPVSDSQAYKQAGNSIVVKCLEKIIKKFRL